MVTIVDNIKIVTNDRRIESAFVRLTRRGGHWTPDSRAFEKREHNINEDLRY